MKYNIVKIHQGHEVSNANELTFYELCSTCSLSSNELMEIINHGIIEHEGEDELDWRFSWNVVIRIQKVRRLIYDLEINMAGAALAIDLLDKIEQLERVLENPHAIKKTW